VRRWARDRDGEAVTLRVWRIFGDSIDSGLPVQRAADAHLLGRLYRQYDEAGLVVHHAYDVDGNLLERTRQVLSEPALTAGPIDWQPHGNLSLDSHARELLDERRYRTQLGWDGYGRPASVAHLEDSAVRGEIRYRHDRAGRVAHVELDGRVLVEHAAWDAAGRRLLVAYGNGLLQRWSRDRAGRVIRLRAERYEAVGETQFRATGRVLQEYWCQRDAAGRLLTLIDDSPDAGLAHKPHRLERTFTWDDDGHLLTATGRESGRAPDWPWEDTPRSAEVVQMRAFSDSYDWRDGRLHKLRHDAGRGSFSREWIFDEEGRLTRLSGSDGYLSYQLDGLGRLALESSVRRFLWDHAGRLQRYRWGEDPPQLDALSRYDGDGALALTLLRRAEGASELVVRDGELVHDRGEVYHSWLHVSAGNWRIATARTGTPEPSLRFYLEDVEGSVALTTDEQGEALGGEGYGALGESAWGGVAGQVFRFHGAERDPITGLYWLDGRPYAPWLGRFIDDLTVLPDLTVNAAPQQNTAEVRQIDALSGEVFRIPIPEDRGTEHGERELPHPGSRHRPEPQGRARPARRGLGQGTHLP
jgi:RHS repeat-associated protein